jgi:hypothetical protein
MPAKSSFVVAGSDVPLPHTLPMGEELTIDIAWNAKTAGKVREKVTIVVNKLKLQVMMLGSCMDPSVSHPVEKPMRERKINPLGTHVKAIVSNIENFVVTKPAPPTSATKTVVKQSILSDANDENVTPNLPVEEADNVVLDASTRHLCPPRPLASVAPALPHPQKRKALGPSTGPNVGVSSVKKTLSFMKPKEVPPKVHNIEVQNKVRGDLTFTRASIIFH